MKLLTSQKNSLFDIVVKAGFSPENFEISYTELQSLKDVYGTVITYAQSEYYFLIYQLYGDRVELYRSTFCPGSNSYLAEENSLGWDLNLAKFILWVGNLKREVGVTDKWKELQNQLEVGAKFKTEEDDKYKFSVAEYEDLQKRMGVLKGGLKTLALPAEQLKLIEAKLDHLTDAAKDMNKFDWKGLFIGSIAGIIIQLSMPTSASGALWDLIKHAFSNILMP